MTKPLLPAALALLAAATASQGAAPIDVDLVIGASGAAGGDLALRHDFTRPVAVTPSLSVDGVTRYTTTQPGFDAVDPLTEAGPGFHPVRDGVPLRLAVTAVEPGLSFKLGAAVLDAPGEEAVIGTAPNLHVHGEWRLELPDGVLAARRIAFRLETSAPAYRPSPAYELLVTNAPDAPPVSTTSTTLPAGAGQPLAGSRLALRPRRSLVVTSSDDAVAAPAAGGPDDPVRAGGRLRIAASGGDTTTLELSPHRWRALAGGRGFRFAGRQVRVVLRAGRSLRIALAGAVDVPAGLPTTAVDVTLDAGTRRWCLHFDGTPRGRRWVAGPAPAPEACTP